MERRAVGFEVLGAEEGGGGDAVRTCPAGRWSLGGDEIRMVVDVEIL